MSTTRNVSLGNNDSPTWAEGVSAETNKIQAMQDWSTPINIMGLRGSLDLQGTTEIREGVCSNSKTTYRAIEERQIWLEK